MYISCKPGGDGVSTWAKFDGHIYLAKVSLLCIMRFVVVYM